MPSLIPYINFQNNGQAAANFYESVFGGAAEVQKDGDTVIQLEFTADGVHFMGSDTEGSPASLVLNCDSEEQLKDFYTKLVDGGQEAFAPVDSGWGALVADCTDRFGVRWMLNYDLPQ